MAYFVYDTNNIIVGRYRTQTAADTDAATSADLTAYQGNITADLNVGQKIDPATGTAAAETRLTEAQRLTAEWRYLLHLAWLDYHNPALPTARQTWWPAVVSDADASTASLLATDRWAYAQIALGDLIAGRTYGASTVTDATRDTIIKHIAHVIRSLGEVWYGVMLGDRDKRRSWSTIGVTPGIPIYSDIVEDNNLAKRTPDGVWRVLAGATIQTGFKPDSATLR